MTTDADRRYSALLDSLGGMRNDHVAELDCVVGERLAEAEERGRDIFAKRLMLFACDSYRDWDLWVETTP